MGAKHKIIFIKEDGVEDFKYLFDQVALTYRAIEKPDDKKTKAFNDLLRLRKKLDSHDISVDCLDEKMCSKFSQTLYGIGIQIFDQDAWDRLSVRMRKNRSRRLSREQGTNEHKGSIEISVKLKDKLNALISKKKNLNTYHDAVEFLYSEFMFRRAKDITEKALKDMRKRLKKRGLAKPLQVKSVEAGKK